MSEAKTSPLPWFKEGLRFKCTECGKCCTGAPGVVWVSEEEMQAIANHLNISVEQFKRTYTKVRDKRFCLVEKKVQEGAFDCIFLKDKKCQIYHLRPTQCKTYPWWRENLNSEESWKLAAGDCEGINTQAPIVPYEEIVQMFMDNEGKKP